VSAVCVCSVCLQCVSVVCVCSVSVVCVCSRCNILISGKIIKEMPGSVASGTHCTIVSEMHGHTNIKWDEFVCYCVALYLSGCRY